MKNYFKTFTKERLICFIMFALCYGLFFTYITSGWNGILMGLIITLIVDLTFGIGRKSPVFK